MNKFSISVIMSVYSEPVEWIRQSIDSILNQTFTDFEFIIVNDNPQRLENTALLDSYVSNDKRIKVINNENNLGLPASLNRALDIVRGKYVARMDADDISLPHRFQYQYDFLENHLDYGICGTYARFINEYSKVGRKVRLRCKDNELKALLLFYSPFMHPSVMVRKELISRLRYDVNCRVGQDVDLWLRMSAETKFYNIPKILLYYRVHNQNSSNREKKKLQQAILSRLALKRFMRFFPQQVGSPQMDLFLILSNPLTAHTLSIKKIDNLFDFLLLYSGDVNKELLPVIFRMYVYSLLSKHSYWKLFYNPFIKKSVMLYLTLWKNYLHGFLLA